MEKCFVIWEADCVNDTKSPHNRLFCCAQRRNGRGEQLEKNAFFYPPHLVKALVGAPSADLMGIVLFSFSFLLVRQSARAAHRFERAWMKGWGVIIQFGKRYHLLLRIW